MAKYVNEKARISVKYIDGRTEDVLFEVNDRNWMNFNELFTAHSVSALSELNFKAGSEPDEIMVISVATFKKVK